MTGVERRPFFWSRVGRGLAPLLLVLSTSNSIAEDACPGLFKRLLAQSGFPTAAYRRSSRELERMVSENLARNGMREPVRTLESMNHSIEELNGGRPFPFMFEDYSGIELVPTRGRAIGREVRFITADGKAHSVEIIVPETEEKNLEKITQELLSFPVDALAALRRVELSPNSSEIFSGLYPRHSGAALLAQNRGHSTLRHEFGHAVAELVWGNTDPYKEWIKAFRADAKGYVTRYAGERRSRWLSGHAEDFAESVMLYLEDAERFGAQFPHRAALLDTIFRNPRSPFGPGGVWAPIRTRYHSLLFPLWRYPIESTLAATIAIPGLGGMTYAAYSIYGSQIKYQVQSILPKRDSSVQREYEYRSDPRFWENGHYRREGIELERDPKKAAECLRVPEIEAPSPHLKVDGPSEAQSGKSYQLRFGVQSGTHFSGSLDVVLILAAPSVGSEKIPTASEESRIRYTEVRRAVIGIGGSTEIEIPGDAPAGKYLIRLCAFEKPGDKIHIVEKNIEIVK